MKIHSNEEILLSHDGVPLHCEIHLHPNHEGIVILLHSYGEHCGRYHHVIEHLISHGFSVYTFDQKSHGKSPGHRGYVTSINDWINSLDMMMDRVLIREAGQPIYLMGHNTGALTAALYYAERRPDVAGMVLSALPIKSTLSPIVETLTSILAGAFPSLPLVKTGDQELRTHDQEIAESYKNDALCYKGKMLAHTRFELLKATYRLQCQLSRIDCPIIALQGSADVFVSPDGINILFDSITTSDKITYSYEGFYHEILNETGRDRVLHDISQWLQCKNAGFAPFKINQGKSAATHYRTA